MKKKLWGGRFKKEMNAVLRSFSYSLAADGELLEAELCVDEAWVKMLRKIGILTPAELSKMLRGLKAVEKDLTDGSLCQYLREHEDIHSLIQSKLDEKAGAVSKKIHTGRSRNDLVVTSTRVYLKGKLAELDKKLRQTQRALVALAKNAGDSVIAGMTHLKKAQPVLMAHHLLAYVEMLEEDRSRLQDALKRIDVLPLCSAALAGSSLPLDQKFLARELGFSKIAANSMAATSDRGFLTEVVSMLAILWMHLSRLSEDFILWNSENFGYIELDDEFATGSSLMPQKKNPDVFELVRGRSGVVFGQLTALLTLQKGLPLAYNRDLQEDKPGAFDAIRKTGLALDLLALTIASAKLNPQALANSVEDDNLYATDVLEYLVCKKVTFSEAHEAVGRVVRHCQESGRALRDLDLREWKKFSPVFDEKVYDLFSPSASVNAKKTVGSTHPSRVKAEIKKWESVLRR